MKRSLNGIRRDMKAMGYDLAGFTDGEVIDGVAASASIFRSAGVSVAQAASGMNALAEAIKTSPWNSEPNTLRHRPKSA